MLNRVVPAAAEGMSAETKSKLEDLIDTARMSTKVANYLAAHFIGSHDGSGSVRLTEEQADLLLYATGRAVSDAEEANAAFLNVVYVERDL